MKAIVPNAFTEQGIAMLSSVLNSDRAIEANIQIMHAFVKLREMMSTRKDLAGKLSELEKKFDGQFQKELPIILGGAYRPIIIALSASLLPMP